MNIRLNFGERKNIGLRENYQASKFDNYVSDNLFS